MGSLAPRPRMSIQRRCSQASAGLVVVGLHLAGMLVWWTAGHDMQLPPPVARLPTVSVALLAPAKPDVPAVRQNPTPQDPTRPTRPRDDDRKPTAAGPTAGTDPAPAAAALYLPPDGAAGQEAQAPVAPALNLHLSRKDITSAAPRSFAEQSPFRGRLPQTVERQIASAAAETGPWTEERIDNDRIRFRRGNTCMTAQRPRAASIDPFSESAARIPWQMSKPGECTD